jgi:transposase-like protein
MEEIGMGKQPSITKEKINAIAELIANGNTLNQASFQLGIPSSTAYNYYKRGKEEGKNPYKRFYEAVLEARSRHEQSLLDRVDKIAKKGAVSTKVKRSYDPDGFLITETVEQVSCDQLRAITWLLEKRYGWDRSYHQTIEKAINKIVDVAKKYMPENQFYQFIDAILATDLGENYELDPEFFLP